MTFGNFFSRPEVISQKNEEAANPGKEKNEDCTIFLAKEKKFVGNYDRRLVSQEMLVRGSIAAQNYGSTSSVEWHDVFQEDPCLFKQL